MFGGLGGNEFNTQDGVSRRGGGILRLCSVGVLDSRVNLTPNCGVKIHIALNGKTFVFLSHLTFGYDFGTMSHN